MKDALKKGRKHLHSAEAMRTKQNKTKLEQSFDEKELGKFKLKTSKVCFFVNLIELMKQTSALVSQIVVNLKLMCGKKDLTFLNLYPQYK